MIRWDPELLALHVVVALERLAQAGDPAPLARYRAGLEPLYALPLEEREAAFHRHDLAVAAELALDAAMAAELAAAGFPRGGVSELHLVPAASERDEGADLVPPQHREIRLRVRPSRLAEPTALAPFLRHELEHMVDLLDPAFGYRGDRRPTGASAEALARDRYRALWCAAIDGRLAAAARLPAALAAARLAAALAAFGLPESAGPAIARWLAARPPHDHLWACACRPETLATHPGLEALRPVVRRTSCPVCRMPAFPTCSPAHDLSPAVVAAVCEGAPSWSPADGLCPRCREIYSHLGGSPCP